MCAIFGFVGRGASRPSIETLAAMVRGNVGRGPHAFGFAWVDSRGRLRMYKQTGRMTDHLGVLSLARDARMLVGHLRWATHGSPDEQINNHPHPADGGWIVHNGVVRNYEQLLEAKRMLPVSECDSEVLGILMERGDGTLLGRCAAAVRQTQGPLAMLGLWSRPATLVAVRRGNPLHVADTPDGMYLATLREGLPRGAEVVKEGTAMKVTRRGRGITVKRCGVPAEAELGGLFCGSGYRGG